MAIVKNYDIKAYECNIAGVSLKDAAVSYSFSPEGPSYTDVKGSDGAVCRVATNERRATMTVTLKGYSEENAKLSALFQADEAALNGAGIAPFLFTDGLGSTIFSSATAWVQGLPEAEHGEEPGDVAWEIRFVRDNPANIVGGK